MRKKWALPLLGQGLTFSEKLHWVQRMRERGGKQRAGKHVHFRSLARLY